MITLLPHSKKLTHQLNNRDALASITANEDLVNPSADVTVCD